MDNICEHGDHPQTTELEIVEYCIDGCRFGLRKHYVVDSDTWHPNYLRAASYADKAVLGTMLYRGKSIFAIDLRQLFCCEQETETSKPSFYTVIQYGETLFTILHDGFLGTCHAPLKHYRSFQSLYVLGIRWLSGVFIFDAYPVIMLSLEALSNMLRPEGDEFLREALADPSSNIASWP